MDVRAKLSSYEKQDFSITLRAPVEDWRAALRQLDIIKAHGSGWVAWPLGGFVSAIEKMVSDLDRTHFDVLEKPEKADD
jgi:hypothetical protein